MPASSHRLRRVSSAFLLFAALVIAVFPSSEASAVVLTLTPSVAAGISNNPSGLASSQTTSETDGFGTFTLGAQLEMTAAKSVHRLGYGFRTIQYVKTRRASNEGHSAFWISDFTLDARTTLHLDGNLSLYGFSSMFGVDPAVANIGATPVSTTSSTILTASATQGLVFQPNGGERYSQSLLVSYMRAVSDDSPVPRTLRVAGGLRADRISGANAYSLNLLGEEFKVLEGPTLMVPTTQIQTDHALSVQLLGGWRRDLSVTTNISVEAGPMAVWGITDSVAWAPAMTTTLGYRWVPWYAVLTAAQQPVVNPYLGEVLIGDSLGLRLLLPLNARETIVATGLAGYTYAREVGPTHDVVLSPHAYSLLSLGASLGYRFDRLPFVLSLDYTDLSQDGETTSRRVYPSSHRRTLSLTLTGNFAWGEGNHGIPIAAGPGR